ncbi:transcriptional regulator [Streptomyces sp. NPDC020917]|uniref:MmyB family transcriptional regulator n=1 Tax=Streptomyces sp. NPDC020917 TaxID=3365102 RepID=UPI00379B1A3C
MEQAGHQGDAERSHLHTLARPQPARRRRPRPQRVHPATWDLLDALQQSGRPAFVLGRRLDVLAHNPLAGRLITDFRALPAAERNQARFVFLDPHARELYRDWARVAADTAAMLRLDAGRHPDDPALSALVGELSIRSEEFRRFWSDNKVRRRTTGTKDYHHPLVGDLTVTYQALTPGDDPDQILFVYGTEPGSPSEISLRLLAQWSSTAAGTGSSTSQPVATDCFHADLEARPGAHLLHEFVDVPLHGADTPSEGAGDDRVGGTAGEQAE